MKLYCTPGTCSLAPNIVLKETGLSAALERVDLSNHTTADGRDFFAVNSRGQVPVLELDDGSLLREGSVIAQYLADLAEARTLLPAQGELGRYNVAQWQNYVSSEIHKGYSPLFNPSLGADAKNLLKGMLRKKYEWLNEHFATSAFLVGDDYTVADPYLFAVSRWSKGVGLNIADLPHLQAYLARIAARPAVQAAMDSEGLL